MLQVMESAALPTVRYFVADVANGSVRVAGRLTGHTTRDDANEELVSIAYARAYELVASNPGAWESKTQAEIDTSARTLTRNGYAYPAMTEGRAHHMGQANALIDLYNANAH